MELVITTISTYVSIFFDGVPFPIASHHITHAIAVFTELSLGAIVVTLIKRDEWNNTVKTDNKIDEKNKELAEKYDKEIKHLQSTGLSEYEAKKVAMLRKDEETFHDNRFKWLNFSLNLKKLAIQIIDASPHIKSNALKYLPWLVCFASIVLLFLISFDFKNSDTIDHHDSSTVYSWLFLSSLLLFITSIYIGSIEYKGSKNKESDQKIDSKLAEIETNLTLDK